MDAAVIQVLVISSRAGVDGTRSEEDCEYVVVEIGFVDMVANQHYMADFETEEPGKEVGHFDTEEETVDLAEAGIVEEAQMIVACQEEQRVMVEAGMGVDFEVAGDTVVEKRCSWLEGPHIALEVDHSPANQQVAI